MNDFATEEFVTKNIRVMPMAGVSVHGDRDSEHQSRHMMGGDVSDQEENKFNIEANHELQDGRENAKSAKQRYDAHRALELEKEQKKARRAK